ncbi:MAG: dihydroorotate dehydrogenase [Acidimicrobiia bacterium]|nr:dihydroorotate dehydrogenase [Acidimicrobiia bacterium]
MVDLSVDLGPIHLASPLVAACGTFGSVVEFARVTDLGKYGAAVAKSVSEDAWPGRPAPRVAPTEAGMLNGIGIQNPGIGAWAEEVGPRISSLGVPVWGSAVGTTAQEFARVAKGLEGAGVAAIEVNLSCPNLECETMFALDAGASARVLDAVRASVAIPVGAKLSPNATDIVSIAAAVFDAGADFVTLTNTVWGAAIDPETRRPRLSGIVGGYSGVAIKPIALRCVIEVHRELPQVPIVGCGGVRSGDDVVEYLLAGASAVAVGTAHFEHPRVAGGITDRLVELGRFHEVERITDLTGRMEPW